MGTGSHHFKNIPLCHLRNNNFLLFINTARVLHLTHFSDNATGRIMYVSRILEIVPATDNVPFAMATKPDPVHAVSFLIVQPGNVYEGIHTKFSDAVKEQDNQSQPLGALLNLHLPPKNSFQTLLQLGGREGQTRDESVVCSQPT